MISISTLFDPRYVFLIYAPILFSLNKAVGHRMVLALSLTEWINQILKWILAGERPYWYVHERNQQMHAANKASGITSGSTHNASWPSQQLLTTGNYFPTIQQFPVTCELGAGSPSGHAMVSATVWYILINALLNNELKPFSRYEKDNNKRNDTIPFMNILKKLTWTWYVTILILISLSRVYLACHFPHQCLTGAVLGLLVARFVTEKVSLHRLRGSNFLFLTVLMFTCVMATFMILKTFGFNPLWSVDKATQWCEKKENLHMDTTPFFSMMRYLGCCFGIGLAFKQSKLLKETNSIVRESNIYSSLAIALRRLLTSALSIYFGRLVLAIPLPKDIMVLFYALSFVQYVLFTYAIAGPIPKFSKVITKQLVNNFRAKKHIN